MLCGQASVLTWHNDNSRTGQNLLETVLAPDNVNSTTFGLLTTLSVDGRVDAQPLYVPNVTIPNQGVHNVLYVATEHGSLYAFDADTYAQLKRVTLLVGSEVPSDDHNCGQVTPEIGVTSTPAIDLQSGATGMIYAVAMSKDSSKHYHQRLHALDLPTLTEQLGSPVEIQASFPGNGAENTFNAAVHVERPGLLISNGVVYTSWGSHCDAGSYAGWVLGYNETTLAQVGVLNLIPNGSDGGIWAAGSGPAADANGNVFVVTGNGTFDTSLNTSGFPGTSDYGNSFVKIATAGSLAVTDYFTMLNTVSESNQDEDLGSAGLMLLPALSNIQGNPVSLVVGAGKDTNIYVMDQNNLGKFNSQKDSIYQELSDALPSGTWSSPAWFNGRLYYAGVSDHLKAFTFSNGTFSLSSKSPGTFAYPGATPSISANGTSNAIVWAIENASSGIAVLHAYDANNVGTELYNSTQAGARDQVGTDNKFLVPTIANSKIFVGTPSGVAVFGLFPSVHIDAPANGTPVSGMVALAGWAIDNIFGLASGISTVEVSVDGVPPSPATYGVGRADVCAAWPGRIGCPNVGFSAMLNLAGLAPGPHMLTVSATGSDSPKDVGFATVMISVSNGPPSVHIDAPVQVALLSGTTTVAGWAIDNTTAIGTSISRVAVAVDGIEVGTATYGVPRADVCAEWPGRPGCPNVGFTFPLNTSTLTAGTHTLTVTATDSDSPAESGATSVTFLVMSPPSVHIDAPSQGATVSGTITVAGWTIDNTIGVGTAISQVQVLVDGTLSGTATYGISRPDVCAEWPGRPGCPNVGFTFSLDTVTLTAGAHIITVKAVDSDTTPEIGSASIAVNVTSTPPTVVIDSPKPGSVLSGTTTVSGWAIDSVSGVGSAIASVQVKVDGIAVGSATYGIGRPDVCAAYPGRPGCPNVGYTFSLNTLSLTAGSHMITVSATDSDGTSDIGLAGVSITVMETPPSVFIDVPSPGEIISGTVTVAGWAIDSTTAVGTAISSVQMKLDGVAMGIATYGTPRPDVCSAWPGRPGCPNVGFTFSLNTTGLSAGTHILTATATDTDGTPLSSSWTVTFQITGPPTVHIDTPSFGASVSGTITIAGWAIDNTQTAVGTTISNVTVSVDGTMVGTATYGLSRPDVCVEWPGRAGCPNVGFTFQLNSAMLTSGSHIITVSATDSDTSADTGSISVMIVVR